MGLKEWVKGCTAGGRTVFWGDSYSGGPQGRGRWNGDKGKRWKKPRTKEQKKKTGNLVSKGTAKAEHQNRNRGFPHLQPKATRNYSSIN